MTGQGEMVKAVAMLSGGLDSSLAVKLVLDQGVEVVGINFNTGFCLTDHRRRMYGMGARGIDPQSVRNEALRTGALWRVPVELVDISEEYLEIIANPRYGYGSAINPCIDCRIFMQRKAREYMERIGARFIITGEVLGQRPMSQMLPTLRLIEKQSGCQGLILRPLSAKLLEPTLPEREGWIDREKLCDFRGRTRKPQMALAVELGLTDYPQPAGGCCFLTDHNYARRLQDLFDHGGKPLTRQQVLLLKVGRHFRLPGAAKLVVGRNEVENLFLEQQATGLVRLSCLEVEGPLALLNSQAAREELEQAAAITARYSDGKDRERLSVLVEYPDGSREQLEVSPLPVEECDRIRL